jgi:hypothetical protein
MSSSWIPRLSAFAALLSLASLTGCGIGTEATNTSGTLNIRGSIFGGQQPVSGASIKLYTTGKTGYGSAATSMLVTPRTSAADGTFNLTGDYSCVNSNDQVYIAATGGNPGLTSGTNNAALVMISALGRCSDLPTTQFVSINELTTVAAVWALAPFIGSVTNIGASPTNALGITNGFLDAALLVDSRSGNLPVLASNLKTESGKIYALANSIASCVNSDGGPGCSPLFTAATVGSNVPTNTLAAALNIVRNPGNNLAAVYNAAGAFPPFPTTLAGRAPNDWTMSLTITGGGLNAPTAIAIDTVGDVWAADTPGLLSGFSSQGTPFSSTGFGSGVLSNSYGLTIDNNNFVWVASRDTPVHPGTSGSVSKFNGFGSSTTGLLIGTYFDIAMDFPTALSADTNGNIMIANYANSTGEIYNPTGGVVASGLAAGLASFPVSVAADTSHGMWLPSQSSTNVTHIAANGTILANPSCCLAPSGVAVDAFGNAWVANYGNDTLTELSSGGTVTLSTTQGAGGIANPNGVVIDGAQDVWAVNYFGPSISHIAGNGGTNAAGTPLSPSGGFGLDASLLQPYSIAVDITGNVWVGNNGNNDLVMFFGIATPTKTPLSPTPAIP